jgi:hypothetical protein
VEEAMYCVGGIYYRCFLICPNLGNTRKGLPSLVILTCSLCHPGKKVIFSIRFQPGHLGQTILKFS